MKAVHILFYICKICVLYHKLLQHTCLAKELWEVEKLQHPSPRPLDENNVFYNPIQNKTQTTENNNLSEVDNDQEQLTTSEDDLDPDEVSSTTTSNTQSVSSTTSRGSSSVAETPLTVIYRAGHLLGQYQYKNLENKPGVDVMQNSEGKLHLQGKRFASVAIQTPIIRKLIKRKNDKIARGSTKNKESITISNRIYVASETTTKITAATVNSVRPSLAEKREEVDLRQLPFYENVVDDNKMLKKQILSSAAATIKTRPKINITVLQLGSHGSLHNKTIQGDLTKKRLNYTNRYERPTEAKAINNNFILDSTKYNRAGSTNRKSVIKQRFKVPKIVKTTKRTLPPKLKVINLKVVKAKEIVKKQSLEQKPETIKRTLPPKVATSNVVKVKKIIKQQSPRQTKPPKSKVTKPKVVKAMKVVKTQSTQQKPKTTKRNLPPKPRVTKPTVVKAKKVVKKQSPQQPKPLKSKMRKTKVVKVKKVVNKQSLQQKPKKKNRTTKRFTYSSIKKAVPWQDRSGFGKQFDMERRYFHVHQRRGFSEKKHKSRIQSKQKHKPQYKNFKRIVPKSGQRQVHLHEIRRTVSKIKSTKGKKKNQHVQGSLARFLNIVEKSDNKKHTDNFGFNACTCTPKIRTN